VSDFRAGFGRLDDAIGRVEDLFIIFAHGAVAGLVLLAVVLRYVFNDPLTWGEELIVGLFTWMIFVGAAAAIRSQMHIRIDVMAAVYANPRMNWLNTVTLVIGIAIIVTMIWACYEQVLQELVVESPMLGVSKAWFAAAMPAGLILMLIHVLRAWMDKGAAPVFRGEAEALVAEEGGVK
jgi:TRAP-type C4-dicarboxylate transport system permease small subunit